MLVDARNISEVRQAMDLRRRISSDISAAAGATSSGNGSDSQHLATMNLASLCMLHFKEFTIWCSDCKEQICMDCVTKREKLGHADHYIMNLVDKINFEVQNELTRKKGLLEMVNHYSTRYASYMAVVLQNFEQVGKEIKISNEYIPIDSTMFPPREGLRVLKFENQTLEEKCTTYPFQNLILEKLLTYSEVLNPDQLKEVVDNYVASNNLEAFKLDLGFTSQVTNHQAAVLINFLTVQRYLFDKKRKEMQEFIALNVRFADEPETPTSGQLSARTSISSTSSANSLPLVKLPPASTNPRFYFDISLGGAIQGRIIIETYPAVAPRMATNFELLTINEFPGMGYRNCTLNQLWQFESIITGSFRYGEKTEGRSVFASEYFRPDDSQLPARRGAVGMRRIKKTSENKGLVGSQFRIILNHEKQFTGIFGQVLYGLEYIDRVSTFSNAQGQPTDRFYISNCGKYEG